MYHTCSSDWSCRAAAAVSGLRVEREARAWATRWRWRREGDNSHATARVSVGADLHNTLLMCRAATCGPLPCDAVQQPRGRPGGGLQLWSGRRARHGCVVSWIRGQQAVLCLHAAACPSKYGRPKLQGGVASLQQARRHQPTQALSSCCRRVAAQVPRLGAARVAAPGGRRPAPRRRHSRPGRSAQDCCVWHGVSLLHGVGPAVQHQR